MGSGIPVISLQWAASSAPQLQRLAERKVTSSSKLGVNGETGLTSLSSPGFGRVSINKQAHLQAEGLSRFFCSRKCLVQDTREALPPFVPG